MLSNSASSTKTSVYRRAAYSTLVGAVALCALIFVPAWTLDYWQGWAFFLTLMVSTSLVTAYLAHTDTALLAKRLRKGPTVEPTGTQKLITSVARLLVPAAFVIMPLDHRFGWSPAGSVSLSIVGDLLCALGMWLYFLVVRENHFASATVEVVEGQQVVRTGPYAVIRHPMYAGALLVSVGAPLALGSWWGFLLTLIVVGVLSLRLSDEERYLREHLPGYADYMHAVRYRLVPFIW